MMWDVFWLFNSTNRWNLEASDWKIRAASLLQEKCCEQENLSRRCYDAISWNNCWRNAQCVHPKKGEEKNCIKSRIFWGLDFLMPWIRLQLQGTSSVFLFYLLLKTKSKILYKKSHKNSRNSMNLEFLVLNSAPVPK